MADGDIIPAFKIGGTHMLLVCLYVFIFFSALHLLVLRFPNHRISKALIALGW